MSDALPLSTDASRMLVAAGERVTAARAQVLDLLIATPTALTHQEIAQAARAAGAELDRVTLYRVLDWLVEKGLAHKIAADDRVWRFNALAADAPAADRMHEHAHFQCRQCGRLYCLDELHPLFAFSLPQGFRCDHADLTLHGACAACTGEPAR
ncbi:MAG: transcriptional repressor [Betaproteobacteria bacterium]|nr:transcriptional repressor [Betaproteobacteria bacterium]